MGSVEKEKNHDKVFRFQSLMIKLWGGFLFAVAMTGMLNIDRYISPWMFIVLGILTAVLVATVSYTHHLRKTGQG